MKLSNCHFDLMPILYVALCEFAWSYEDMGCSLPVRTVNWPQKRTVEFAACLLTHGFYTNPGNAKNRMVIYKKRQVIRYSSHTHTRLGKTGNFMPLSPLYPFFQLFQSYTDLEKGCPLKWNHTRAPLSIHIGEMYYLNSIFMQSENKYIAK